MLELRAVHMEVAASLRLQAGPERRRPAEKLSESPAGPSEKLGSHASRPHARERLP